MTCEREPSLTARPAPETQMFAYRWNEMMRVGGVADWFSPRNVGAMTLALALICLASMTVIAAPPSGSSGVAPKLPATSAKSSQAKSTSSSGGAKVTTRSVAKPSERYQLRLRELEERVVDLKDKIFRTKSRLLLLKERIVNDVIAEAKVILKHQNDMGSSFKLQQVLYELDGEKVYYQDASSSVLDSSDPIEIFSGNLLPGNHVLKVEMVYRGDSAIFGYLQGYEFRLRASYAFYATKGKITTVNAIGYQKGDITYDLTKRPSIKFRVKQVGYTRDMVGVGGDEEKTK